MGGVSCWRRPSADGDHTHALVAAQSHSFPDNLVALSGPIRAWHCSTENARAAVGVFLRGAPVHAPRRFTDLVLPQLKKAGASDALDPLSSNDVAATMALNSVRISGWWLSR